jgi:dihydropteroate synthase
MVRISRFASKYLTTAKKKPKKLKDTLSEDQLAAFIAGKPTKKYAKSFKKQQAIKPKKDVYEFDKTSKPEPVRSKPTGFMQADLGKMGQRKAVTRIERLDMARNRNLKDKARKFIKPTEKNLKTFKNARRGK